VLQPGGDGRLGDVERLGRTAQVLPPGNFQERFELREHGRSWLVVSKSLISSIKTNYWTDDKSTPYCRWSTLSSSPGGAAYASCSVGPARRRQGHPSRTARLPWRDAPHRDRRHLPRQRRGGYAARPPCPALYGARVTCRRR